MLLKKLIIAVTLIALIRCTHGQEPDQHNMDGYPDGPVGPDGIADGPSGPWGDGPPPDMAAMCPTDMNQAQAWVRLKSHMCLKILVGQLRHSSDNCQEKVNGLEECFARTLEACPCFNNEMDEDQKARARALFAQQVQHALAVFCSIGEPLMAEVDPPSLGIEGCTLSEAVEECCQEFIRISMEGPVDMRLCNVYNDRIKCVAETTRTECPNADVEMIGRREMFRQHMNIYCNNVDDMMSDARGPPPCPVSMEETHMWGRWKSNACHKGLVRELRENKDDCAAKVTGLGECIRRTLEDCDCYNNEVTDEIKTALSTLFDQQSQHASAMFCSEGEPLMGAVDPPSLGFCDLGEEVEGCCDEFLRISGEDPVDERLCDVYNERIVCIAMTTKRVCSDAEESAILQRAMVRQHMNIYCTEGPSFGGGHHSGEGTDGQMDDDGKNCPTSLPSLPMWVMWRVRHCHRKFIKELRKHPDGDMDQCQEEVDELRTCIEEKAGDCIADQPEMIQNLAQRILDEHVDRASRIFCSRDSDIEPPVLEIEGCDMTGGDTEQCHQQFQEAFREDRLDERLCDKFNDMIVCYADGVREACDVPEDSINGHVAFLQSVNMFCPDEDSSAENGEDDDLSGGNVNRVGFPLYAAIVAYAYFGF